MRVFNETQRFNQWWIGLLHLASIGFLGYCIYRWFVLETATGNVGANDRIGQLVVVVAFLVGIGILYIFRLETAIDDKGIVYRFFPIHRKPITVTWDALEKVYVRKYRPISEFGGWGYRIGFGGKAYNIKGNQGIQLKFKSGKKLLIGTQKPKEAQQIIDKYFKNERV